MKAAEIEKSRRILKTSRTELLHRLPARREIGVVKIAEAQEEAQLDAERDITLRNLDSGTRCLRDIDAALARIEEGTYGICIRCEESIGKRRLDALPWTALCLVCQQEIEGEYGFAAGAPTSRCA